MKRTMMQIYVKNSLEAMNLYQQAFDAKEKVKVLDDDGGLIHGELMIETQCLAISEQHETVQTGTVMQFCLHFDENEKYRVKQAFDLLKVNAEIHHDLGSCFYSDYMTDLTDQYGVRWCMFI